MRTEQAHVPNQEMHNYASEFGTIMNHEGVYHAVTADGEQSVPVPTNVAEHIALAMKLQDKALDQDEDARNVLQTFNCRKSAKFILGKVPFEQFVVEWSSSGGEEAMFRDVELLLKSGNESVAELKNYADFEEVLHGYEGAFPCIVHIFESDTPVEISAFPERVATLHRVHSFVVLGEDESGYVCFQKMGPDTDQPFIICDLEMITTLYSNQKKRTGYFVYGSHT